MGRLAEELGFHKPTTGRPEGPRRRGESPPPCPVVGGATNLIGEPSGAPNQVPQDTLIKFLSLSPLGNGSDDSLTVITVIYTGWSGYNLRQMSWPK